MTEPAAYSNRHRMSRPQAAVHREEQQLAKLRRVIVHERRRTALRGSNPRTCQTRRDPRDGRVATGKHCLHAFEERVPLVFIRQSMAHEKIGDEIRIGLHLNDRVGQDCLDL